MIKITNTVSINEDDIDFRFIRSPGPGGQHVNKVESAVQIRFDAKNNEAISESVFSRLKRLAGSRMTLDGEIIITSSATRSQVRNRQDALSKLTELLRQATVIPKPRKKSRPSLASKTRFKETKKRKSSIKKLRSKAISD